jgi:2-polyprenyl-3-methyl-5-hydroxy-6-metoxy-1,4-benzoquinol methylase
MEERAILLKLLEAVQNHGPWINQSIHVGQGIYTQPCHKDAHIGAVCAGASGVLLRLISDLSGGNISSKRVVDVGASEGLYGIEAARAGASVTAIVRQNRDLAKIECVGSLLSLKNLKTRIDDLEFPMFGTGESFDFALFVNPGELKALNLLCLLERVADVTREALILYWGLVADLGLDRFDQAFLAWGFSREEVDRTEFSDAEAEHLHSLIVYVRKGANKTLSLHLDQPSFQSGGECGDFRGQANEPASGKRSLRDVVRLRTRLHSLKDRVFSKNRSVQASPGKDERATELTDTKFDKYVQFGAYHWTMLQEDESYRRRVMVVARHLELKSRCLDLGCGDGAYMEVLAPFCELVVGVDADETGIGLAKTHLAKKGRTNCRLIHSTFEDLDAGREEFCEPFDLVYSMDCIEHLKNPRRLLEVADQAVSPDGVVLIGTPEFVSEEEISPYHEHEYTQTELECLLQDYFRIDGWIRSPAPLPTSREVLPERFMIAVCRPRDIHRD